MFLSGMHQQCQLSFWKLLQSAPLFIELILQHLSEQFQLCLFNEMAQQLAQKYQIELAVHVEFALRSMMKSKLGVFPHN